jgi:hypothetical protein
MLEVILKALRDALITFETRTRVFYKSYTRTVWLIHERPHVHRNPDIDTNVLRLRRPGLLMTMLTIG